jgi:hypothetical protein
MSSNSTPTLLNPPSPRTHRALRRLQSAHTLGQHTLGQSNNQPSLITQQHKQALQRNLSPANTPPLPTHSRGRSNSEATNMTQSNPGSAARRSLKRPLAADALSLDRLIRDGPPDGNLIGALESTRLKILDQGIKSDTDGMVRAISHQEIFTNSFSLLYAFMYGSYYSMRPSSKPTPTSLSSTVVHPQHIPRSETIPFGHWQQTLCSEDALVRPVSSGFSMR